MDGAAVFGASVPTNVFDAYKKAVYRAPPARFVVDMLPPAKQGSSYSYGMRIIPLTTTLDDRSSIFSSISDRCIDVEYDIYRRWEDCLAFQQLVEEEYRVKSLQKRQKLIGGKSSKSKEKDSRGGSIYSSQSSAASFESLPDGPDVSTIAKDFHQLVPRLTKKASLFRASPATINQRHKEMQVFIEYLFHEDQPVLIKELLRDRKVTDFFGYWRRDYDLATANRTAIPADPITASIESTYFRDRNSSRISSTYSPRYSISSNTSSTSSLRPVSSVSSSSTERAVDVIKNYRRRLSTSSSSSDSSSGTSRRLSTSSDSDSGSVTSVTSSEASVPSIHVTEPEDQEKAKKYASMQTLSNYAFKPNKYASQDLSEYNFTVSSAPSIIGDIPEDSEYLRLEDDVAPVPIHVRRPRGATGDRRSNRACSIYSLRPGSTFSSIYSSYDPAVPPEGTGIRESWQSTSTVNELLGSLDISLPEVEGEEAIRDSRSASRDSVATVNTIMSNRSDAESILNGLRGTYTLSAPSRSRESVATFMTTDSSNAMFPRAGFRDSVATFMTTDSANAMFPRGVRDSVCSVATVTAPNVAPSRNMDRPADVPDSVSGRPDSMISLEADQRIESTLYDQFPMPWGLAFPSRPATPPVLPLKPIKTTGLEVKHTRQRSSSVSTISSTPSEPPSPPPPAGTISIKAAYEGSIIILRVSSSISFDALKQRLYAKFVKQEGQDLSKSFIVAIVSPNGQPKTLTHKRSSSLTSVQSERSVLAESRQLQAINNQGEWERCITASTTSKLTLRIFDNN